MWLVSLTDVRAKDKFYQYLASAWMFVDGGKFSVLFLWVELVSRHYKDGTPESRQSVSAVSLLMAIMRSDIVMLCHCYVVCSL